MGGETGFAAEVDDTYLTFSLSSSILLSIFIIQAQPHIFLQVALGNVWMGCSGCGKGQGTVIQAAGGFLEGGGEEGEGECYNLMYTDI